MYTLKSPSASQYVELGRAISEMLLNKKIEMIDRRNVTALYLGTIAGGSLPVTDGHYKAISEIYRTQHLPAIKQWLGRLAEAVSIDIDLALIAAYNRYALRCSVAYPQRATLSVGTEEGYAQGMVEQLGLFKKLLVRYPDLRDEVQWSIRSLITQEKIDG